MVKKLATCRKLASNFGDMNIYNLDQKLSYNTSITSMVGKCHTTKIITFNIILVPYQAIGTYRIVHMAPAIYFSIDLCKFYY